MRGVITPCLKREAHDSRPHGPEGSRPLSAVQYKNVLFCPPVCIKASGVSLAKEHWVLGNSSRYQALFIWDYTVQLGAIGVLRVGLQEEPPDTSRVPQSITAPQPDALQPNPQLQM